MNEAGFVRKMASVLLAAMAARLTVAALERLWTRTVGDLPGDESEESLIRRLTWIGLTAAAVGIAREAARELAVKGRRPRQQA